MCDVDYFKRYNDTYGHLAGDDCLRAIAGVMRQAVRRPADLVARYGGEEFVMILPNTNLNGASKIAESIRIAVRNLKIEHISSTVNRFVTVSLGVAEAFPCDQFKPELLVETALALASHGARFADCGTGTGCIAVTLCAERPDLSGIACDISSAALAVAARNMVMHLGGMHPAAVHPANGQHPSGLRLTAFSRCQPVLADFTRPLFRDGALDLLVSNPPYVSEAEHAGLTPEVRDREPRTALVPCAGAGLDEAATAQSRADGLGHARVLVAEAGRALRPDGLFLMEFGCAQGQAVADLFAPHAWLWADVDIRRDLAGLDRFVVARRARTA